MHVTDKEKERRSNDNEEVVKDKDKDEDWDKQENKFDSSNDAANQNVLLLYTINSLFSLSRPINCWIFLNFLEFQLKIQFYEFPDVILS